MTDYPLLSPIRTGLSCTCPRCGKAPLFRSLLIVQETCPSCGFSYKFVDSGDGPAIFAIFILGFAALGGAMIAHFSFELPLTIVYPVLFIATPLLALWLLRALKATLIALQYRNKAEEGRLATGPTVGPTDDA